MLSCSESGDLLTTREPRRGHHGRRPRPWCCPLHLSILTFSCTHQPRCCRLYFLCHLFQQVAMQLLLLPILWIVLSLSVLPCSVTADNVFPLLSSFNLSERVNSLAVTATAIYWLPYTFSWGPHPVRLQPHRRCPPSHQRLRLRRRSTGHLAHSTPTVLGPSRQLGHTARRGPPQ